jgi:Mg2+ and Co2+ transporter CorA
MLADIKEEIRSRSAEERAEIAAYLRILDRLHDSTFQQQIGQRAAEMNEGIRTLSGASVTELDRQLTERGL